MGGFSAGPTSPPSRAVGVSEYRNGRFLGRADLDADAMFPGQPFADGRWAMVARAVELPDATVYLGAHVHNDLQSLPFGVFVARSLVRG